MGANELDRCALGRDERRDRALPVDEQLDVAIDEPRQGQREHRGLEPLDRLGADRLGTVLGGLEVVGQPFQPDQGLHPRVEPGPTFHRMCPAAAIPLPAAEMRGRIFPKVPELPLSDGVCP